VQKEDRHSCKGSGKVQQNKSKQNQKKNKTSQQGFFVSMEDARELKFNLDVIRKEAVKLTNPYSNITMCCTTIARILNKAKEKTVVKITE